MLVGSPTHGDAMCPTSAARRDIGDGEGGGGLEIVVRSAVTPVTGWRTAAAQAWMDRHSRERGERRGERRGRPARRGGDGPPPQGPHQAALTPRRHLAADAAAAADSAVKSP